MDGGAGSPVGFAERWAAAAPVVAGYLTGLLGERDRVDDLLQETALSALGAYSTFDASRPFVPWAVGIARHLVHQHWARLVRHGRVLPLPELIDSLAAAACAIDDGSDDEQRALQICLDRLQGRSREAVRLHYQEGRTTAEVGVVLGLEGGAVRVLLHRVRQALRTCIEERLGREGRS